MARQKLGQHFLRDQSVAYHIAESANISHDHAVVEIGPGKGALTDLIVDRARAVDSRVILIEIDRKLADILRIRYAHCDDVTVVCGDARDIRLDEMPELCNGSGYKVVANLPYYAGTPIVRGLLERCRKLSDMVVMLQREVAKEMCAQPGDMSLLSIAIQIYAEAKKIFDVGPEAFRPRPEVHSRVIRITPLSKPRVPQEDTDNLFRVAKFGFRGRRKQLHNSLANGLEMPVDAVKELAGSVGIDTTRRPATLSIEEWHALSITWRRYLLQSDNEK